MKRLLIILLMMHSIVCVAQKKIGKDQAQELLNKKDIQLLDVRTLEEFNNGFIKGAVHIDYFSNNFLSECLSRLDLNKPVIVYCAAGGRSAKAASLLKKKGFKTIYDLSGGYESW